MAGALEQTSLINRLGHALRRRRLRLVGRGFRRTRGGRRCLRPIGIRYPLTERVVLMLDPVYMAYLAPVLSSIPLVQIQYRSGVALEVRL